MKRSPRLNATRSSLHEAKDLPGREKISFTRAESYRQGERRERGRRERKRGGEREGRGRERIREVQRFTREREREREGKKGRDTGDIYKGERGEEKDR